MNQPPPGPDPGATEPIPVTPVPSTPRSPRAPRVASPGPFVPRFGNVATYLVARLVAFTIDFVALAFVLAAFGFNAFERGFLLLAGRNENGFATLAVASFGVAALVAFLCESLFGTTLGKSIFGLRVSRTQGGVPGVWRVFVRYVLRPVDLLAIGPLLALVTPRHQRLGDFAGGTVVSRGRFAPLASLIALALLAGIAYAQFAFGGGLDSALGVGAEAANYGPDLVAKSAALVGLAVPHPAAFRPPVEAPAPTARPAAEPSPLASDEPSPGAAAGQVPETGETDAPAAEPTDPSAGEPADEPTDAATGGTQVQHV
jgi:uncharacterized RDD family membrane protein YckC